ncbi:MAG: autotransporter outer membrane beta-barrel domain-containing protein [Sideroxyarcus sp.]|nr:autotransporter outer membrane beta-barrel domain-containing protein [Sideroxyarcus sp.]
MNSGDFRSRVGRGAFICKLLVLVLGALPLQSVAITSNEQLHQYVDDLCNLSNPPSSWDPLSYFTMCTNAATGGPAAGPTPVGAVSANLGTVNAGTGAALRKKKGNRVTLDEQKEKPEKGASADGGGWGFLMAPQYGNSSRIETDLENGYQANLKGLIIGLDYRFSDSFVLGAAVGQTKDDATFLNSVGSLKTRNNTFSLYGTWLPTEYTLVDSYLGYGNLSFENKRQFDFGSNVSGTMSGNTSGRQIMAGLSASYQTDFGQANLASFINLDYIKTSIGGYNESGSDTSTNLMALHYGDRNTISFTNSVGARVSTSYGYDWGTLQPSARLAVVHEYQNNANEIPNELAITPGMSFAVSTDAPDRNYLSIGLGVSAALNGGTQLFLDYDKRTQDELLSSWAVSLGAQMEF